MKIVLSADEVKKAIANFLKKKPQDISSIVLRRKSPKTEDLGSIIVSSK
ncbi:MAG: hypothetical protein Q7R33_04910 [Nitrosarchaeum sp.]|nr:hypothetical protein [Nitrosarchaeum sp.]